MQRALVAIDPDLNSPEFIALSALVTAHLMSDFVWQSDQAVKEKQAFNERAYAGHGTVHAAVAYLLAANWTLWQLPVLILVHPLIDFAKDTTLRWLARRDNGSIVPARWKLGTFCLDQAAHVASLVAIVGLLPVARGYWSNQLGPYWLSAMVLASGVILTVRVGGVVVGMLNRCCASLRPPRRTMPTRSRHSGVASRKAADTSANWNAYDCCSKYLPLVKRYAPSWRRSLITLREGESDSTLTVGFEYKSLRNTAMSGLRSPSKTDNRRE